MKAHLELNVPKEGYDLYLWHEDADKRVPFVMKDGRFLFDDANALPYEAVMQPTMFIDRFFYAAIRQAMIGEAIDNDDALRDTRAIRDRLLKMVETEWQSRQLDKP